MTITETIDNAIADWETSPDAMRWTPDAPKLAAPVMPRIVPPSPEQMAALSARFQAVMAPVVQQMQQLGQALAAALPSVLAELQRQQRPARSERIRRMRTAYGQRRR